MSFTVEFDQFVLSMLNKMINKKKKCHPKLLNANLCSNNLICKPALIMNLTKKIK